MLSEQELKLIQKFVSYTLTPPSEQRLSKPPKQTCYTFVRLCDFGMQVSQVSLPILQRYIVKVLNHY